MRIEPSATRHSKPSRNGDGCLQLGADLTGIIVSIVGALTIFSGAMAHRVQRNARYWWMAQLPAVVAWGWVGYSTVYTFLVHPY